MKRDAWVAVLVLMGILLVLTGAAIGLDPRRMRYDVVTIKPSTILVGLLLYGVGIGGVLIAQARLHRGGLGWKRELGLAPGWAHPLGRGLLLGLAMAGVARGITILLATESNLRVIANGSSAIGILWAASASVILLTLNSVHEELLFRAYPLSKFRRQPLALFATAALVSVLFALLHASAGASLFASVSVRFALGLLLSFLFVASRSIWMPVGVHSGVNLINWGLSGNWGSGAPFELASSVSGTRIHVAGYVNTSVTLLVLMVAVLVAWRRVLHQGENDVPERRGGTAPHSHMDAPAQGARKRYVRPAEK